MRRNRHTRTASFAKWRAWKLLSTPNAHPSPGERDESEAWLDPLGRPWACLKDGNVLEPDGRWVDSLIRGQSASCRCEMILARDRATVNPTPSNGRRAALGYLLDGGELDIDVKQGLRRRTLGVP